MTNIKLIVEKAKIRIKNMPKFKLINKLNQFALSLVLIIGITLAGLQSVDVKAANTTMYLTQTKTFTVNYFNAQNEAGANPMHLEIFIGNKLQIDPNSFKDTFNNGTPNCINSAFVLQNVGGWGNYLKYTPRSSTAGNVASCTGASNAGTNTTSSVEIPIGQQGTITFTGTLTNYAGATVGDVLDPSNIIDQQGVKSTITTVVSGTPYNSTANLTVTVVATPTVFAKPDPTNTTGGGTGGTLPQPVYTDIIMNPNPGLTGQPVVITTTGLQNNADNSPLDGAACATTLTGAGGFTQTSTGTVANGTCTANFTGGQTPTTPGTYQAVTTVTGPTDTLTTAPESFTFNQGQSSGSVGARFGIIFTPDAKNAPFFNADFGQVVVSGRNLEVTDDADLSSAYTCKIEAKLFEVDNSLATWITLGDNITYTNASGCSANFTQANRTALGFNLNYRFKITITRTSDNLVVYNSSTIPLQIGGGGNAN
jgi:hypothetical protein